MSVAKVLSWDSFDHLGAPDRLNWGINPSTDFGELPMSSGRTDLQTAHGRAVELTLKPLGRSPQARPRRVVVGAGAMPSAPWIGNLPGGTMALAVGSETVAPTSENPLSIGLGEGLVFAIAMQLQAKLKTEPTKFTAWCRTTWIDAGGAEKLALFSWDAETAVQSDGSAPIIGAFSLIACIKKVEIWAAYPTAGAVEPAPFAIGSVEFQFQITE